MNILRASPDHDDQAALRRAIVETGRIAYERGHLTSNDGNISIRLSQNEILITPSGLCKGRLSPEDLLIVDLEGKLVTPAADPALKPTSEQPMHLEAYRQREDVTAVLHAHPPFAIALTVAGKAIPNDVLPEVLMLLGNIPVTDYATPSSEENATVIRGLIQTHDALILRQHGSLTVGRTLDDCLIHLDRLEHVAKVITLAEMMGQVNHWPQEKLPALLAVAMQ